MALGETRPVERSKQCHVEPQLRCNHTTCEKKRRSRKEDILSIESHEEAAEDEEPGERHNGGKRE